MSSVPPLLSFLLMVVSGWVQRHQLVVIDFLQAENRLLKEKLGKGRIRFSDAERALLARKAKAVGRKALLQLDTIVSPDTLLRWHRQLVAQSGTLCIDAVPAVPGSCASYRSLSSGWRRRTLAGDIPGFRERLLTSIIAWVAGR